MKLQRLVFCLSAFLVLPSCVDYGYGPPPRDYGPPSGRYSNRGSGYEALSRERFEPAGRPQWSSDRPNGWRDVDAEVDKITQWDRGENLGDIKTGLGFLGFFRNPVVVEKGDTAPRLAGDALSNNWVLRGFKGIFPPATDSELRIGARVISSFSQAGWTGANAPDDQQVAEMVGSVNPRLAQDNEYVDAIVGILQDL